MRCPACFFWALLSLVAVPLAGAQPGARGAAGDRAPESAESVIDADAGQAPGPVPLEEVVVTAGFRDEPLMTSPGSATVLDSDDIEGVAAQHLETVLVLSPNVSYSSGASRARFVQVRGIGDLEQFVDPKHYPSVGLALDGIDVSGAVNAAMLFDTERVEVLRGPQGTRFGTSALAGLVNVRSRAPTRAFDGYVSAGVADYGTAMLGAVLSGPLSDAVSARLTAHKHQSDGYIENAFLGRDDTNGFDETTVRAAVRIDPGSGSVYDLTLFGFDTDNGYDAFSLDNVRVTLSDQPGYDRQSGSALSLRGSWPIGTAAAVEATLTHLTSDVEYGFDEDWTYVGICDGTLCDPVFDFYSNTDAYARDRDESTLDVRWVSARADGDERRYELVAGLYLQERDENLLRQYYGDFLSDYATERRAAYAQANVFLSARVEAHAGLRYERFEDGYVDSFDFASASDDELHTGELGLSFDLTDAIMLYASIARGEKAGGVNTEASASRPYMQQRFQGFLDTRLRIATETLTSRELGAKARFDGGRINIQAAVFDMERRDAQLESWLWDSENFIWVGLLDNVAGSNRGVEFEVDALVGRDWELSAALGLLATDVDSILTFDLDLDEFVERRGIDQAKSPDWQASLVAEWRPTPVWSARFELEARDGARYGYYHDGALSRASILNASLTRRSGGITYKLYGRNLTDEDVEVHALYFGNDPRKGWINESYRQLGEPRILGLALEYEF